jgi:hypothetical protein
MAILGRLLKLLPIAVYDRGVQGRGYKPPKREE